MNGTGSSSTIWSNTSSEACDWSITMPRFTASIISALPAGLMPCHSGPFGSVDESASSLLTKCTRLSNRPSP
jgi:hypothetical protein